MTKHVTAEPVLPCEEAKLDSVTKGDRAQNVFFFFNPFFSQQGRGKTVLLYPLKTKQKQKRTILTVACQKEESRKSSSSSSSSGDTFPYSKLQSCGGHVRPVKADLGLAPSSGIVGQKNRKLKKTSTRGETDTRGDRMTLWRVI